MQITSWPKPADETKLLRTAEACRSSGLWIGSSPTFLRPGPIPIYPARTTAHRSIMLLRTATARSLACCFPTELRPVQLTFMDILQPTLRGY